MKRFLVVIGILFLFVGNLGGVSAAETGEELPAAESYFDSVYQSVPEEVKPFVKEEYTAQSLTVESLMPVFERFLNTICKRFFMLLLKLLSVIIPISLIKRVAASLAKDSFMTEWISGILLLSVLVTEIVTLCKQITDYGSTVLKFTLGVTATLASVMTFGGNAVTATTVTATVSSIGYLLEFVCIRWLIPVVMTVLATMIGSCMSSSGIALVGRGARSLYQWLIGFLSFFSVMLLSYQSILAHAEDTVASKTVRYAVSGSIPIVGGAVGESMSVLTSSIRMIRSGVGVMGVLSVLFLSMIPIGTVISLKFAVFIAEELSSLLELSQENGLLCETRKLINMLLAITVMITILFIFIISLYMMIPLAYS